MPRVKLLIFKIACLSAAFVMAVVVTEMALRLSKRLTNVYYPAGKTFEAIYKPNSDYVYGLKPDTVYKHCSYYGDFVATYRINSEGLRADRVYGYKKPDGTKRVLMLGDSYCFGRGVENNETCAFMLEKLFNGNRQKVEVLNSGVLGYSTDNEYLYLKRKGLLFSPDIVVLMLFPRNDVMDMLYHDWITDERGLPLRISDRFYSVDTRGHLVDISKGKKNLNPSWIKTFVRDNSYLYVFISEYRTYFYSRWSMLKGYLAALFGKREQPSTPVETFNIEKAGPDERTMLARMSLLLDGMKDTVIESGAKFLVVLIPDSNYDGYLLELIKSRGIDVIDIRECAKRDNIRSLYLPRDMHWSKSGNAYVAGLIYDKLKYEIL